MMHRDTFIQCFNNNDYILMEGALGERLKREYSIEFDKYIAMASLIYTDEGREALRKLWNQYISIAYKYDLPFMATTPTRRVNQERLEKSPYNKNIIRDNVEFLKLIRNEVNIPMYIGGLMGCKGDAYSGNEGLSIKEAKKFHQWQCELFKEAAVDFLFAGIMPTLNETIGMAEAMGETKIPYIICFMIKNDGRLLDGTTINDAIKNIDEAVNNRPICYMTNCVHPEILRQALLYDFNRSDIVKNRFKGIQANTSKLSPEELDGSYDLKTSDPIMLAKEISKLKELIDLKIIGGCCGTDNNHMEEIAKIII